MSYIFLIAFLILFFSEWKFTQFLKNRNPKIKSITTNQSNVGVSDDLAGVLFISDIKIEPTIMPVRKIIPHTQLAVLNFFASQIDLRFFTYSASDKLFINFFIIFVKRFGLYHIYFFL